ncbi:MAG: Eco57I restriction-modification methylase domain-containing protein [Bellilinea sp.]
MGGLNFGLRRTGGQLRAAVAGKITALKTDKLDYYNNKEGRKYTKKEQIEQDERWLFQEILEEELRSKTIRQTELQQAASPSRNLFGEVRDPQMKLDLAGKTRELEQVNEAIAKLRPALAVVKSTREVPFVWDLAFVEIFEGEKGGFDIVVGNPPYVRQEKIHDPALPPEKVTPENKQDYKQKLSRAVYSAYPQTFGFKPGEDRAAWSLDKKSDLYIYFYFMGLSLLNNQGSFCFITSNSWLDVGYGSDLQRFLLTRSKVKLILDNQVKRSFKSADVNTIIALLAAPQDSKADLRAALDHIARFVMFKVPFENGLSAILWEDVEETRDRKSSPEMRVVVKKQQELLESGIDAESSSYDGDKWGGKYLRSPDIFTHILEKGRGELINFGSILKVKFGIKSGADNFFYLNRTEIDSYEIESEFINPIVVDSKQANAYELTQSDTDLFLVSSRKSKKELLGTKFLKYIHLGETKEFPGRGGSSIPAYRPSCRNRKPYWYSIDIPISPELYWMEMRRERYFVLLNSQNIAADHTFYGVYTNKFDPLIMFGLLNISWIALLIELFGNDPGGSGTSIQTPLKDINKQILIPKKLLHSNEVKQVAKELKNKSIISILKELSLDYRRNLDSVCWCNILSVNC